MTVTKVQIKREKPGIKQEIRIIPGWAFALAASMFLLAPILFGVFAVDGPLPFRLLISVLPATILAFLSLMIGYVNRDSGRRGMSRALWTVIVILVPNAIGFILYFLLRNPVKAECPKCQAVVDPHMNYCPHCRYSFHPMCSQCKKAVRPEDTFCANCGTELERSA
jgi:Double zinc ribbon/Phospholipase_D-nuclease N-terminal